ncbi:hypothetical protein E2562_036557 [Oryza meyeriana var. granulata]|uniref:Vps52 C-terminal domain-containing protein n=1 Tax=Oryza meyeriana var. granulata TaxID=110450 RepID=A0A6G1ECN8_9ORYZ|nr:hypothetical protein E2562_036557 [Oryza meyeriana var. granulata]
MVFDMHLNSLRNANVKTLWEDDVHPHYVMRRYAEFTASLVHLNVEYGDGQLDLNLERLRMAVEDLLEAGTEGGKAQLHFEEVLKSNIAIYVRKQ